MSSPLLSAMPSAPPLPAGWVVCVKKGFPALGFTPDGSAPMPAGYEPLLSTTTIAAFPPYGCHSNPLLTFR